MTLQGGCFCGQVRYATDGVPFHSTVCHCADCRLVAGAPMMAWFSVRPDELRFTAAEPRRFASSPGVTRSFCGACGTPLTFQDREDTIDVSTCSLDAPEAMPPADHTWTAGRLPWVRLDDGLPCYPRLRADGVASPGS